MVVRTPPPPSGATWARRRARGDMRYRTRLQRAWRAFGTRWPRMRRELARYASTHMDRVRATVHQVVVGAALAVLGLIVAVAVLATAVVLLVVGLAGALAAAFGDNAWLGNLVAGGAVLTLFAGAIVLGLRRDRAKRMHALEQRYARYDDPAQPERSGRDGAPVRSPEPARPDAVRA